MPNPFTEPKKKFRVFCFATKDDLDAMEARINKRLDGMEARLTQRLIDSLVQRCAGQAIALNNLAKPKTEHGG